MYRFANVAIEICFSTKLEAHELRPYTSSKLSSLSSAKNEKQSLVVGSYKYSISGIDLKKESDKQKVIKAISKLSDILFTFIPSSITKENIDIIIKMREDNIPVEKIAYYTGIPKEIIVSI